MPTPASRVDGQINSSLKVDSSGSFEMIDSLGQQDGFEPTKGSNSGKFSVIQWDMCGCFYFLFTHVNVSSASVMNIFRERKTRKEN